MLWEQSETQTKKKSAKMFNLVFHDTHFSQIHQKWPPVGFEPTTSHHSNAQPTELSHYLVIFVNHLDLYKVMLY